MIVDVLDATEKKSFSDFVRIKPIVTKSCGTKSGTKSWKTLAGKHHRVDGPAIEGCDLDGNGDGLGLHYWLGHSVTKHQHACLIKTFSAKEKGSEYICRGSCLDAYIIDYDTFELAQMPGCWYSSDRLTFKTVPVGDVRDRYEAHCGAIATLVFLYDKYEIGAIVYQNFCTGKDTTTAYDVFLRNPLYTGKDDGGNNLLGLLPNELKMIARMASSSGNNERKQQNSV